jgi:cob(I)alamin adenosyltransferase
MATKIYTKTGDAGLTGLFSGGRVSKDDVRVTAYGEVDELNAALGMARAVPQVPADIDDILNRLQHLLFDLGADLATPAEAKNRPVVVGEHDVAELEKMIDHSEAQLAPLKNFVLPGGSQLSATLHLARCICRRAERHCVSLRSAQPDTSPLTVIVLNRLSDLLFVLARLANVRAGVTDVPWVGRGR